MHQGSRCPQCWTPLQVDRETDSESCPQRHYSRGRLMQPTKSEVFTRKGFDFKTQTWRREAWLQGWD